MAKAPVVPVTADMIVDELMATHAAAIAVFLRRRMLCVGCPIAPLHDVRHACLEHAVPLEDFLRELNATIGRPDPGA